MASINIQSYWSAPIYLSYLQPDLTDEMVKEAEKKLGFKLPKAYIDLLKIQNGGYIRYKLEDILHSVTCGIGPHFPNLTDFDWSEDQEYVSFDLHGLIPFDGDGHWHLCFDYRKNAVKPQISYVDVEIDEEYVVADSFEDYLSKLTIDTTDSWVIETDKNLETIVEKIEKTLTIQFEEPDLWAHGFPIYRCSIADNWICINPNKVPKGFVRTDDVRYEELKEKVEGTALRYPELGKNCLLLGFTDEKDAKKMIPKLTNNGIMIRPLSAYFDKKG